MIIRNSIVFLLLVLIVSCTPSPPDNVDGIVLHPDFVIERVASEPLIFDPVDLEFDANGEAFVLEMPGYPQGVEQSRLIWLEDQNGDGIFDRRHIFAENLGLATSILPYENGWLVAAPPNLLFLRDDDGDHQSDHREIMLSGFSLGNLQHNFNGLTYGLDNWIYAADGGNSGNIYWPGEEKQVLATHGQDFRFHFKKHEVELIGESSGGFGLTMDDWGNFFETHNLYHISHLVFPGRYIEGLLTRPYHSLHNVSAHNDEGSDLARIYPIGKQDTRVNHPEQAGYFSGSCGITHYGGGAFPEGFNGNIFVADVVLNLVHRDVLTASGATFLAQRGREKVEFLASPDRSFRPVNMTTGPDGALYLVDMYREVIEHPEWIPDEMEVDMDLNAGKEKGRIYRISPKTGMKEQQLSFSQDQIDQVVKALAHSNQWWRITAQRLLVEWKDTESIAPLLEMLETSPSPLGRLHALRTLEGLEQLHPDLILKALQDEEAQIRKHAIQIAESRWNQEKELREGVLALAIDSDPGVVLQVGLSLSVADDFPGKEKALLTIANQYVDEPWIRLALLSGSQTVAGEMIRKVIAVDDLAQKEGGEELLRMLGAQLGRTAKGYDITSLLRALEKSKSGKTVLPVLDGLGIGLERRNQPITPDQSLGKAIHLLEKDADQAQLKSLWTVRKALGIRLSADAKAKLAEARQKALDPKIEATERLEALELMAFSEIDFREKALWDLLNPREPESLQLAAIRQLGAANSVSIASKLVAKWPELGPQTRSAASDILLYQRDNHPILLSALESGGIRLGEMNFHLERRRTLLFSEEEAVRNRAEMLFSDAGVVTRKEAMEEMKSCLQLTGNAKDGQKLFSAQCGICHTYGQMGTAVGPDLTEIQRKSPATLLHDIIDPNAAVDTRYLSHQLETAEGEILSGIIAFENDQEIRLLMMGGIERSFQRENIARLQSSGLSLMPEGLEAALEPQQMADVLAFLQSGGFQK